MTTQTPTSDAVGYIEDAKDTLRCAYDAIVDFEAAPFDCNALTAKIADAIKLLTEALTPDVIEQAKSEQKRFNELDALADANRY